MTRLASTQSLNDPLGSAHPLGKEWQRQRRDDPFYKAAKGSGYRARSAFKLLQINQKFKVIRSGNVVVDLGAAPGGWSQVAKELVGDSGLVIGVDLAYIKPVLGVTFVRGDMTSEGTVQTVLRRIEERVGRTQDTVDVVISDMSPNISGNYTMDQALSYFLCTKALEFTERVLKHGGHFVTKIFEGEDFPMLREAMKERFAHIKTFSPPASRKESSEVYLIGMGYRGRGGPMPTAGEEPEETEAWWEEGTDDDQ